MKNEKKLKKQALDNELAYHVIQAQIELVQHDSEWDESLIYASAERPEVLNSPCVKQLPVVKYAYPSGSVNPLCQDNGATTSLISHVSIIQLHDTG